MPVDWQLVQIPFSAGLNQKGDKREQAPPLLDICKDVEFDDVGGLRPRKPYAAMGNTTQSLGGGLGGTALADCRKLVANGDELLLFTKDALYTWDAANSVWRSVGTHLAIKMEEATRFATTADQITADRAELNGTIVYTWAEGTGAATQVRVAAFNKTTGAVITAPKNIATTSKLPKLVALSTKILLFYVKISTGDLCVSAIDPASVPTMALAGSVAIANGTPGYGGLNYDAARVSGADTAIIAAQGNPTTIYCVATVTAGLAITTTTKARTCDGPIAVSVSPDGASAQIVRGNGTNVQGDLLNASTLADVYTAQAIGTSPGGASLTQIAAAHRSTQDAGAYRCYAFWSHDVVSNNAFFTKSNWVDTANMLGSQADFVGGAMVASRAFTYDGRVYVWLAWEQESVFDGNGFSNYSGFLENTYFLYRDDAFLCAKAVPDKGGGRAASSGHLPTVALTSGSTAFSWCAAIQRSVVYGNGTSASQTGERAPQEITFTFDTNEARRCARLGGTLYIACSEGTLQYDGVQLVETGLHIYPAYLSVIQSGTGSIANGTYTYKGTARWINGAGELDRCTTATAGNNTIAGGPAGALFAYRNLTITHKTNPALALEFWRTAVNPADDSPYYLLTNGDPNNSTNPNRYIPNDQANASTPQFRDEIADGALTYRATNNENGGVLENLAAPAASLITFSEDRIYLAGIAGDPDRVWYSKRRSDGEVVAFHDALTIVVPAEGGAITGLAWLNETLIVFRETAIYALPGDGFDNTGGGSNYGPARYLSLDCGATNHESIVATEQGLVFKSSKGWYLLNRGWTLEYIGAPVVNYDSETILAAHLVTSQHQIRILSASRMLVFDYLVNQWGEWTITDGIDADIWQGTYSYLTSTGPKTEQTTFSAVQYGIDIETAWIKMQDLQGAGRVRWLMPLGEYRSTHQLRIRVARDYQSDGAGGWTYFDDVTWTPTPTTVGGPEQVRHGPSIQQVQAIKIRLTAIGTTRATASVTHANGTKITLTARTGGTAGNSIVLASDDGAGPTTPTITDIGTTVNLSSSATTTFDQVAAAVNASSALVSAVVTGTGSTAIGSVLGVWDGTTLTGGTNQPNGECLKLSGIGLEVLIKRGLFKRLPAAQKQ